VVLTCLQRKQLRESSKEAGMWDLLKKKSDACGQFRDELDASAGAASQERTPEELFAALSAPAQQHGAFCAECRAAAEELLSARALLRALPAKTVAPSTAFVPRVMAAIAAREAELRNSISSWAAIPTLASRLALASAALLLLISTWIYERPVRTPAKTSVDSPPESLFESSPLPVNPDDFLVSQAERPQ
jgi:hypothetical protein